MGLIDAKHSTNISKMDGKNPCISNLAWYSWSFKKANQKNIDCKYRFDVEGYIL